MAIDRQVIVDSVLNGLNAIEFSNAWIMVHDAARPCIRSELIEQFIDELENDSVGGKTS